MSDEKGIEVWGVFRRDNVFCRAYKDKEAAQEFCGDRYETVKRCLLTPIKEEKKVEVTRSQVINALKRAFAGHDFCASFDSIVCLNREH